jgi:hypothetical protein
VTHKYAPVCPISCKNVHFVQTCDIKNRDFVQKFDIKNRDLVQNTCAYQLFLLPLQQILKVTGYET